MYAFFKSVHILGFVLMAGNVTVTALWKVFADRTSNTRIIAFAQWLVTVTDYSFTFFGGFLMVVGGYGAAWVGHLSLFHTPWLVLGQLMLASGGRHLGGHSRTDSDQAGGLCAGFRGHRRGVGSVSEGQSHLADLGPHVDGTADRRPVVHGGQADEPTGDAKGPLPQRRWCNASNRLSATWSISG